MIDASRSDLLRQLPRGPGQQRADREGEITGFIGPSGCGKSTVLRSLNRMNDLIRGFRLEGPVHFHGQDVYGRSVGPGGGAALHRQCLRSPTVLDEHLEKVAFGLGERFKGHVRGAGGEQALRKAACGTRARTSSEQRPVALRCGQQQRLCIARAVPTEPSVLLMDEPARRSIRSRPAHRGAHGPAKQNYTIAIVTHNMQQPSASPT